MNEIWQELLNMGFSMGDDIPDDYLAEACFNCFYDIDEIDYSLFEYTYGVRILPSIIDD